MTLFEVGVIISILVILAVLLLPALSKARRKSSRIHCINCLKQIGLTYRIWESENGDVYPMGISTTYGGSMEMVTTGNVVRTFQVMSNELGTTKILTCPMDLVRTNASSFAILSNTNLSCFVATAVTNDLYPQMILSGDANFALGGIPVKSGLLEIYSNRSIAWTPARHGGGGNLGMADGSVQQVSHATLPNAFGLTGVATNRFAIP